VGPTDQPPSSPASQFVRTAARFHPPISRLPPLLHNLFELPPASTGFRAVTCPPSAVTSPDPPPSFSSTWRVPSWVPSASPHTAATTQKGACCHRRPFPFEPLFRLARSSRDTLRTPLPLVRAVVGSRSQSHWISSRHHVIQPSTVSAASKAFPVE
jgi:hypothetical protein